MSYPCCVFIGYKDGKKYNFTSYTTETINNITIVNAFNVRGRLMESFNIEDVWVIDFKHNVKYNMSKPLTKTDISYVNSRQKGVIRIMTPLEIEKPS